ncbi:hypothetical protein [Streptomyces sp. NBC_00728]|jgi:hypothetical protein|uniref:hypothetical protein n=1 Tax=Streptomyces sp. NBC_00728 TaxID=2903676 RepID=UPI0038701C82
MTIAQCLAVIDRLCSEDFPAERSGSFGGSYGGPGGPGFHVVELQRSAGPARGRYGGREEPDRFDVEPSEAEHSEAGHSEAEHSEAEQAEQFEAEREALARRLADRWGEPGWMSLDGVFLRVQQGDERIPEPWASLGSHMRNAQVWEAAGTGRWVALGISRLGEDQEFRLLAVITETDPP